MNRQRTKFYIDGNDVKFSITSTTKKPRTKKIFKQSLPKGHVYQGRSKQ